jgi:hypothetical protein
MEKAHGVAIVPVKILADMPKSIERLVERLAGNGEKTTLKKLNAQGMKLTSGILKHPKRAPNSGVLTIHTAWHTATANTMPNRVRLIGTSTCFGTRQTSGANHASIAAGKRLGEWTELTMKQDTNPPMSYHVVSGVIPSNILPRLRNYMIT